MRIDAKALALFSVYLCRLERVRCQIGLQKAGIICRLVTGQWQLGKILANLSPNREAHNLAFLSLYDVLQRQKVVTLKQCANTKLIREGHSLRAQVTLCPHTHHYWLCTLTWMQVVWIESKGN